MPTRPPEHTADDTPDHDARPRLSGLRARVRPLWLAFDRAAQRPWAWALAGLAMGLLAFAGWHWGLRAPAVTSGADPESIAATDATDATDARAPGLGLPVPDASRTEEVVGLDPTLAARPEDQPARPEKALDMPPPIDNPELGGVAAQDAALAAEAFERWMPPKRDRLPPRYPRSSLRRGEEGSVLLAVTLDRSGHPNRVDVASSSRSRALDRAAVDAVRQWRFAPARPEEPDLRRLEVPIDFRID